MALPIIKSGPDDVTQARSVEGTDGYTISMSTNPNSSYRDESGTPINHDAVAVTDISGIAADRFTPVIEKAIEIAHANIMDCDLALVPSSAVCPADPKHISHDVTTSTGGTTATMMLYDPASFKLHIGSKGDSPVFVILDDGHHTAAVKVSSSADSHEGNPSNCLNDPICESYPLRQAEYTIGTTRCEGTVDLYQLIRAYKEQYNLGKANANYPHDNIKVSVLVASDGIIKPLPDKGLSVEQEEVKIATLYKACKNSPTNKAQALTDHAIAAGSQDNISAIVLENIEPGKGKPVAAVVCDGFYKHGYLMAQTATHAIEEVLKSEKRIGDMKQQREQAAVPSLGSRIKQIWTERVPPFIPGIRAVNVNTL